MIIPRLHTQTLRTTDHSIHVAGAHEARLSVPSTRSVSGRIIGPQSIRQLGETAIGSRG